MFLILDILLDNNIKVASGKMHIYVGQVFWFFAFKMIGYFSNSSLQYFTFNSKSLSNLS